MGNEDRVPLSRPATDVAGILPLIAGRWSPRAFDPRPVGADKLMRMMEAARWAPSCFNEQPWRFFVATAADRHRALVESFLVDGNAWAKRAPVLIVGAAVTTFALNGKQNGVALHDLGLASYAFTVQALQDGLAVHGMAGFDASRAQTGLAMPADWRAAAMWAVGYPGRLTDLPEPLARRELEPRTRRPLAEIVRGGAADEPHVISSPA